VSGLFSDAATYMFSASADDRGTVQALAKELDSHAKHQFNNSVVQVLVSERGDTRAGELVDIIHVDQSPLFQFTLGRFKWLRPLNLDLSGALWASL
jgi:hypothetical protein